MSLVPILQAYLLYVYQFPTCLYSFLPDAEVIYVVSEVLAQFPELHDHNYKVLLTHTNLLSAVLGHCSIASDMKNDILSILRELMVWSPLLSAVVPVTVTVCRPA